MRMTEHSAYGTVSRADRSTGASSSPYAAARPRWPSQYSAPTTPIDARARAGALDLRVGHDLLAALQGLFMAGVEGQQGRLQGSQID